MGNTFSHRETLERISELLFLQLQGSLSADQKQELEDWQAASPERATIVSELLDNLYIEQETKKLLNVKEYIDNGLLSNGVPLKKNIPSVHRIHFLRTAWFRYAAAILLIFGTGSYLWNTQNVKRETANEKSHPVNINNDVLPGGNKAVLSLADGTTIVLDSAGNGTLAQQGNASIVKLNNGQIVYKIMGSEKGEVLMNTMSTPKGEQYQLTLPDGTRVWLNAASSIIYPAVFTGKERKVTVTGEVYFEVAKIKRKPFIVDIDGKSLVEVLGTSFNINSYPDESSVKTTLIEGSVKVISEAATTVILKPGQQAQISTAAGVVPPDRQLKTIDDVDMEQVMAWKNGLFNFHNADLPTVMRQLERWYDIKVEYEGAVPEFKFQGKMDRGVNLSEVLEALTKMGTKLRIEGKTLIVSK